MNKMQIAGIVFLLAGIISYFLVENEPYTTLAGFSTGAGFTIVLVGAGFSKKFK